MAAQDVVPKKEYDLLFNVVLVGDSGVGKTGILSRYADGIFTPNTIPMIGEKL